MKTKESARLYFESRLWPDGVICPVCKSGERITARKGGYYRCNACEEDFTVRTGTIMERSHVPLHKWLYAMYLLVTARKGISSMQLAKEIGVTQKSAWFLLHRLREACGGRNLRKLKGIIEHHASQKHLGRYVDGFTFRLNEGNVKIDGMADVVLAYRPIAKSKPARRRKRRANKIAREMRAEQGEPAGTSCSHSPGTASLRVPTPCSMAGRSSDETGLVRCQAVLLLPGTLGDPAQSGSVDFCGNGKRRP